MEDTVLLGHGSGGTMMKRIIDEVFFEAYAGEELRRGDDAAVLSLENFDFGAANDATDAAVSEAVASDAATSEVTISEAATSEVATPNETPEETAPAAFSTDATAAIHPPRLAFSTDSFVVDPHFFPGGDIGKLAICGTVNDIATSGAIPRYLSCGFILEEGFPIPGLKRICESMAKAAAEAGVKLVTGDTKVVNRGHGDGVFINTSGIGIVPSGVDLSGAYCKPGDKVLVSGTLGDHGITIMSCRESLSFTADVQSDAAPLNNLIAEVLRAAPQVRCFRDPTRGGLASTLNELASQSGVDILVDEEAIPVRDAVRGACDMLGYDVLQVANEGKMVCVVAADQADAALAAMRANRYGADAAIIGEVSASREDRGPKVYVRNAFGGRRVLDMLVGEQLPRIC